MAEKTLFFVHYGLLLLFGILLSLAFGGVQLGKKRNLGWAFGLFLLCGTLQLAAYGLFDEELVWKLYPLIAHLPVGALLCLRYRRPVVTALAAISTAYLCCQPAKWMGLLCGALTNSYLGEQIARILVLLAVGFMALGYLAPYLAELFAKDLRSVCIFGSVPIVYYLFDYATGVYTDLWTANNRIAAEFLPFLLCVVFLVFCLVYHKEYEKKADAQRREQIIRLKAQQQAHQVEAMKRSEQEIRLLRHDMRLFLNSLAVCLENGEQEKALKMLAAHTAHIEGTKLERFCRNDTVNCVLSSYAVRCRDQGVNWEYTVELEELKVDEILFASILSNALDNALNAQEKLPESQRSIRLMLKTVEGKLLLSLKNPTAKDPVFVDGLPVTSRKGHGYGTQSIRYITQRLGGNCQFSLRDGWFAVRVVL